MNTPNTISRDMKNAIESMKAFSDSDCHLEDLADCYGLLCNRLKELTDLRSDLQKMLIEQGHLSESGDAIQSDSFRVLFSLRDKSGKLDKTKLESKYPEVFADVWTRGYGSSPVITSRSVS